MKKMNFAELQYFYLNGMDWDEWHGSFSKGTATLFLSDKDYDTGDEYGIHIIQKYTLKQRQIAGDIYTIDVDLKEPDGPYIWTYGLELTDLDGNPIETINGGVYDTCQTPANVVLTTAHFDPTHPAELVLANRWYDLVTFDKAQKMAESGKTVVKVLA